MNCFRLILRPKPREFKQVVRKDRDILSYLILYLLPIIRSDNSVIIEQPLTAAVSFIVIFAMMIHVGMYHINPIIAIFGFRIYHVELSNSDGTLIARTKEPLYYNKVKLNVVTLSSNLGIYMHTRSMNV